MWAKTLWPEPSQFASLMPHNLGDKLEVNLKATYTKPQLKANLRTKHGAQKLSHTTAWQYIWKASSGIGQSEIQR